MRLVKVFARCLAATLVSITAGAAWAQQSGASESATSVNELDEVVVTARRREERLQDVPVAVTAVTETTFERQQIVGLEGLHLSIPNMTVVKNTTTTNAAQIYIRGIGQDDSTYNSEPGVGVYVDGVPLGKQNGAMLDLIEFERIEVLRGPQGTLYGRNSTGGAVKFVTRRPDLNEVRGTTDLTIGSFGRVDARGAVSLPISEGKLVVKFDGIWRTDDGFVDDRSLGDEINTTDRRGLRGALLWQATDATSVYATIDRTWDESSINSPIPVVLVSGRSGQNRDDFVPRFGDARTADPSIPNIQDYSGGGASIEVTHNFGWGTLQAISGYRSFKQELAGDLDGAGDVVLDFIQDLEQRQFSQEVQLASSGDGRFNWLAGVFYFDEKTEQGAQNTFQATNNDNEQKSRSAAVYGEVSFALVDTLKLTVGGRYTEDTKRMEGLVFNRLPPVSGFNRNDGTLRFAYSGRVDFDDFSPRAVLDWKPTDDVLLYASWSEGYKAGVFSAGRPTTLAAALGTLPPETVRTIEVGAKSTLLDRRLVANVSLFDSKYDDLQLSFLAGGVFFIAPAGAEIKGAELELTARPLDGLTLYGTLGLLDAEITEVTINPATNTPVGGLFVGAPLKHVPETMFKVGFDWNFPIGQAKMGLGANVTRGSRRSCVTTRTRRTSSRRLSVCSMRSSTSRAQASVCG
jgi:iron complex outermembrane recepter protein